MKKPYLVIQVDGDYDCSGDYDNEKCYVPAEWTERLVVELEDDEAAALNAVRETGIIWRAYEVVPAMTVRDRLAAAIEAAKAAKKRRDEADARSAAAEADYKARQRAIKIEEARRILAEAEAKK